MAIVFDGQAKEIIVTESNVNVETDLYLAWKTWFNQGNNSIYDIAFTAVGGDDIGGGSKSPTYFFLQNGWKVVIDGVNANIKYNLFSQDQSNPYILRNGGIATPNNSESQIIEVGMTEADIHTYLDNYLNKDQWKNTETEVHNYLDSYANKDTYKADVSNLATTASVTALDTKINGIDTAVSALPTTTLTQAEHDHLLSLTNSASLSETELHNALDSYTGKWKWKSGSDEFHQALDTYPKKYDWKLNTDEFHIYLDTYPNKDDYKANTGLITAKLNALDTKVDALPTDTLTQAEHDHLLSLTNSASLNQTDIHNALDSYSNKDSYKADTSLLNTISSMVSSLPTNAGLTLEEHNKLMNMVEDIMSYKR